jgi:hypothetical protein
MAFTGQSATKDQQREEEEHFSSACVQEEHDNAMSTSLYIGPTLALLGSNLCGLLLLLNSLGWFNILHADLQGLEQFVESTLSHYQVHFQTATVAYCLYITATTLMTTTEQIKTEDVRRKYSVTFRFTTLLVLFGALTTLALPHVLLPHRQLHPIIRRSLVGYKSELVSSESDANLGKGSIHDATTPEQPPKKQELVFSVDNMTCGGCGSHIRDMVERALSNQQHQQEGNSSFKVETVLVDWKAGVLSIHGFGLQPDECGGVNKEDVSSVLSKDGYPTKFLYAN